MSYNICMIWTFSIQLRKVVDDAVDISDEWREKSKDEAKKKRMKERSKKKCAENFEWKTHTKCNFQDVLNVKRERTENSHTKQKIMQTYSKHEHIEFVRRIGGAQFALCAVYFYNYKQTFNTFQCFSCFVLFCFNFFFSLNFFLIGSLSYSTLAIN